MVRDESLLLMSKSRNLKTSRISSWNLNPSTSKMPENSRGKRWRATRLCRLLSAAKVGLNFSIFAALLMVISASTTISAIHSCNRGRFVVNSTWGAITNGPENYREDSYCVWLIEAQQPGQYITLTFHSLQTECAYDHVFVYDGDSVLSPMKGSFSGRGLPPPVIAKSGSMVVLLYSDTNYVLEGFSAEYSVTDCPLNCSNHGHCVNHSCVCEAAFVGESCEFEACPDQCGFTESRGWCEKIDGVYQRSLNLKMSDRDEYYQCLCRNCLHLLVGKKGDNVAELQCLGYYPFAWGGG